MLLSNVEKRVILMGKHGKTGDFNGKIGKHVEKRVILMEKCEKTWKNWKENVEKLAILMGK